MKIKAEIIKCFYAPVDKMAASSLKIWITMKGIKDYALLIDHSDIQTLSEKYSIPILNYNELDCKVLIGKSCYVIKQDLDYYFDSLQYD